MLSMVAAWWSTATAVLLSSLLVTGTTATPTVYFPINSQLPPVARISQPFSFVFSPITFSSPFPAMSYSLANAPSWLSIDSDGRRLFGTPGDGDVPAGEVVGIAFELVATDRSGTVSANSTLVVSRNPPPRVMVPLTDQLQDSGAYSAPSSLLLGPSEAFSCSFDAKTFGPGGGSSLSYYAVSGNNAPLPSWVRFTAPTLTFSGRSPSFESQAPEHFDVQLVASDVVGFSSVSIPFSLVVGSHKLTAQMGKGGVVRLNATRGQSFRYTALRQLVQLDERPVTDAEVRSIRSDQLPTWLVFDPITWEFSGTPGPTADLLSNVSVAIVDNFSDRLNITLAIHVRMGIFRSDLPTLDITAGSQLSFDLSTCLWDPPDTDIAVDSATQAPWFRLEGSTITSLPGSVPHPVDTPTSPSPSPSRLRVQARSKSSGESESRTLTIRIKPSSTLPSTGQPTGQPTAIPTTTATAQPSRPEPTSNRTVLWILLPIFILCIALVIILFCLQRRRLGGRRRPTKHDVSAPFPRPGAEMQEEGGALHDGYGGYGAGPVAGSGGRTGSGSGSGSGTAEASQRRAYPQNLPPAPPPSRPRRASSSLTSSKASRRRHAAAWRSGYMRSRSDPTIRYVPTSWQSGQAAQGAISPPNRTHSTGGPSFRSDTSTAEGEHHIQEATPAYFVGKSQSQSLRYSPGLDEPSFARPYSIQFTPDMTHAGPVAGTRPSRGTSAGGYLPVRRSRSYVGAAHQGRASISTLRPALRDIGRKMTHVWNRASATFIEEWQRSSKQTASTAQTAHTTISTEPAPERPTTSTIPRPTVVHIPTRPGEVRQISRRVDGLSPFFSGRSVTRSPRSFAAMPDSSRASSNDDAPKPAHTLSHPVTRPGSPWDGHALDSLGIAYQHAAHTNPDPAKHPLWMSKAAMADAVWDESQPGPLESVASAYQWPTDQWPVSETGSRRSASPSLSGLASISSGTPAVPPLTLKAKGKDKEGNEATWNATRPSTSSRTVEPLSATDPRQEASEASEASAASEASDDEWQYEHQTREQQALAELKAKMFKPTTPPFFRPSRLPRPSPKTPNTPKRWPPPLADDAKKPGGLERSSPLSGQSDHNYWTGFGVDPARQEDFLPEPIPIPDGDQYGAEGSPTNFL